MVVFWGSIRSISDPLFWTPENRCYATLRTLDTVPRLTPTSDAMSRMDFFADRKVSGYPRPNDLISDFLCLDSATLMIAYCWLVVG